MAKKKKPELKIIPVKSTDAVRALIERKARRYAKGNVSALMRHAATVYTPRKGEKINLKVS